MKRPLCCICAAFVATVFIYLMLNPVSYNDLGVEEGTRIRVIGEVTNKEYKNEKLVLYLNNIRIFNEGINNIGNNIEELMCYTEYDESYNAPEMGCQIMVEGKVSYFKEPRNPGEFNARLYYKILGIDAKLYKTEIVKKNNTCNLYKEYLYNIRRCLENIYDQVMNEKDASIMKAMVLGNKTELDYESKQLFQKSGIAHVFAISGLHITLLGMGLYKLLKKLRLPKLICCIVPIALMFVYGDMVGMSSSAFRAIVMFGFHIASKLCKRTYDMLTAIAVSAVLVLKEQPLYLYHSGYLLSFGAVLGIGCFLEVISPVKPDGRLKPHEKIKASLAGSLSIYLIHFPIMLATYYEFPIYSFLLNLVIIPSMTIVMFLGIACLATGFIPMVLFAGMAKLIGLICHYILGIFEALCSFSLKLEGSKWIVGKPDLFHLCIYITIVIYLYIAHNYGVKMSKKEACVKEGMHIMLPVNIRLITILIAVVFISGRAVTHSSVNFLDVGQGDSIYVESKGGASFLIDGGSSSNGSVAKYTLVPYLKSRGVSKLDAVFLTHLDSDHTSGIIDMLSSEGELDYGIDIERLFISEAVIEDEAYEKLVNLCDNRNIPIYRLKAGDKIGYNDVSFEVLHPSYDYKPDSRNAYSLVMKLVIGEKDQDNVSVLLTGDVSEDGERIVAKKLSGDIDIYKAAHHGSKYSNKSEIVNAAAPELTVISCAEGNSYGHPHSEAVDNFRNAGSDLIVTKDTGAIMITIDGGDYKVKTYIEK
jgi:competence protein ComEC